jgi:hypothetical protein
MINLGKSIGTLSEKVIVNAEKEKWENVIADMNEINRLWEEKSIWTALTIKTNELEEIEISFKQSRKYAELLEKEMFLGEFIMFSELVKHIPHHEGFHIEELL